MSLVSTNYSNFPVIRIKKNFRLDYCNQGNLTTEYYKHALATISQMI